MKRKLGLLFAVLLLLGMVSFSQAEQSLTQTGDGLIIEGKGTFLGLIVVTDATNAVTVDIYDNTSASGTKLIPTWTVTTSATDRAQSISFNAQEVKYEKGIYVDVTCAGTVSYMVYYERE